MDWIIFSLSTFFLWYIYFGFRQILRLCVTLSNFFSQKKSQFFDFELPSDDYSPGVTIYFPAFNEEDNIEGRITNILNLDYPPEKVELIVISDGSTDNTALIANHLRNSNPERDIKVISFKENRGRHVAQNEVASCAKYDILAATDADARFAPNFLKESMGYFSNPKVAVVGGEKHYRNCKKGIAQSIGIYQKLEFELRRYEQQLGVMCKTDGMCTLYRKEIWCPIEQFEDVDHVVVPFARKKGLIAVHSPTAICYDSPNETFRQEIKARSRMTRKSILSTLKVWGPKYIIADPFFSFILYSHKLVRFLSPIFLFSAFVSLTMIVISNQIINRVTFGLFLVITLVIIGMNSRYYWFNKYLLMARSFLIANLGFAMGVYGFLAGNKTGKYKPTRNL